MTPDIACRLPPAALEDRLRKIAEPIGRHPVLGGSAWDTKRPQPTAAAVLVPIVLGGREPEVLLTVRHSALRSHPGQISFPGGRCDDTDADVAATALREAHEEVGLNPTHVKVLGALPAYLTGTGYSVVPVLGTLAPGYPYQLAVDEVAEVFHVPLPFLLDGRNRELREYEVDGHRRGYFEFWFGRHRIWGATAEMIVSLEARLAGRR